MSITQEQFDAAHAQWHRETYIHSFTWTILKGEGFEKIKAFGKDAIPFLLRKLQENDNVQVWGIHAYLSELTGEDIFVGVEEDGWRKGNVQATTDAWLKWGREKGFIQS